MMHRFGSAMALVLAFLLPAVPVQAAPIDIGRALAAAVTRCFNPPAQSSGSVVVRFELAQDGTVSGTPVVNGLASAGVAKAAIHAVEFCQPYRLPPERFSDWQHASVKLTVGAGR